MYFLLSVVPFYSAFTSMCGLLLLLTSMTHFISAVNREDGDARRKGGKNGLLSSIWGGLRAIADSGLWDRNSNQHQEDDDGNDAGKASSKMDIMGTVRQYVHTQLEESSNLGKWLLLVAFTLTNIILFSQRFNFMMTSGLLADDATLQSIVAASPSSVLCGDTDGMTMLSCPNGQTPNDVAVQSACASLSGSSERQRRTQHLFLGSFSGANVVPPVQAPVTEHGEASVVIHADATISYSIFLEGSANRHHP